MSFTQHATIRLGDRHGSRLDQLPGRRVASPLLSRSGIACRHAKLLPGTILEIGAILHIVPNAAKPTKLRSATNNITEAVEAQQRLTEHPNQRARQYGLG